VAAWIKVTLLVLLVGAVLVPGVLQWASSGRFDYAVVGAGGLFGVGFTLRLRHQRERDRS
jgi:hypothetical protein